MMTKAEKAALDAALRALRAAIEADTAGLLADIDAEIEKEVMS